MARKTTAPEKGTCQLCYTPNIRLQQVTTGAWGLRKVCQECADCYAN